jgi:hypothetical protein
MKFTAAAGVRHSAAARLAISSKAWQSRRQAPRKIPKRKYFRKSAQETLQPAVITRIGR